MSNKSVITQQRLQDLRSLMAAHNFDYYLVFTNDFHQSEYVDDYFKTREYISGFTGSAGWMVISKQEAVLWADGRYYVQAAMEIKDTDIILYKHGLPQTPSLVEYLRNNIKNGQVVACDGRTIDANYYNEIKLAIGENTFVTDVDLFDSIWTDRPQMSNAPIIELPLSISGKSRNEKLQYVRCEMEKENASVYILSELSSIMWLFNIRGKDVSCNPVAYSHCIVTNQEAKLYLQPNTYSDKIKDSMAEDAVSIEVYNCFIQDISLITKQNIVLDPSEISSTVYGIITRNNFITEVKNTTFIPKFCKNETEIALSKKYHELDAVAMIRFIKYIKKAVKTESISEYEAAKYLDSLRSLNEGFYDLSFETISAYQSNAAIVHYSPKEEDCAILAPKGMLLVDSGAQYMGATTDITRTIVLGPIKDVEKKHFTAVLKAMIRLAEARFMEHTTGANLDILARGPIWDLHINYRHGTGHGIGSFLNVHEGPQAFHYNPSAGSKSYEIKPGMITSDEPGIYIEGSHGIRTENEILCVVDEINEWGTFYKFEMMTWVPIDLDAIDISLLNSDEINWLNSYHKTVYEKIAPHLNEEERNWLKNATRAI